MYRLYTIGRDDLWENYHFANSGIFVGRYILKSLFHVLAVVLICLRSTFYILLQVQIKTCLCLGFFLYSNKKIKKFFKILPIEGTPFVLIAERGKERFVSPPFKKGKEVKT